MIGENSPEIAWRWESFAEVDSTNIVAMERVRQCWGRGESAAGLVIAAQRQRGGKGQHGRTWESPGGGLYMSAVMENVPVEVRGMLALLAGTAVVGALQDAEGYIEAERARRERWRVAAEIVWPNDVYVRGKKVAGILCEGLGQGSRWAAIIGVGVNVTTEAGAFSADVAPRATSLLIHDCRLRSIEKVGHAILHQFDIHLQRARSEGMAGILEQVRAVDFLKGKRIRFDAGVIDAGLPTEKRDIFAAITDGIDANGALILRRISDMGNTQPARSFATGSILLIE